MRHVQTWSNWIKLDKNGSMWFKMDQVGLNLNKLEPTWTNLNKLEQTWTNLNKLEQTKSNLLNLAQNGLNLFKHDQTCSNLFKLDQIVSNASAMIFEVFGQIFFCYFCQVWTCFLDRDGFLARDIFLTNLIKKSYFSKYWKIWLAFNGWKLSGLLRRYFE